MRPSNPNTVKDGVTNNRSNPGTRKIKAKRMIKPYCSRGRSWYAISAGTMAKRMRDPSRGGIGRILKNAKIGLPDSEIDEMVDNLEDDISGVCNRLKEGFKKHKIKGTINIAKIAFPLLNFWNLAKPITSV